MTSLIFKNIENGMDFKWNWPIAQITNAQNQVFDCSKSNCSNFYCSNADCLNVDCSNVGYSNVDCSNVKIRIKIIFFQVNLRSVGRKRYAHLSDNQVTFKF